MCTWRQLAALALSAAVIGGSGCRSTCSSGCGQNRNGAAIPHESMHEGTNGGLLTAGANQLGPGVGENRWRWQGDGQWGF